MVLIFKDEISDRLFVKLAYNYEYINGLKQIKGRIWDAAKKVWSFPSNEETLDLIIGIFKNEKIVLDTSIKASSQGEYLKERIKQLDAYFGDIRTLIPETSGQHIGIIRTAYRKHPDTLSS